MTRFVRSPVILYAVVLAFLPMLAGPALAGGCVKRVAAVKVRTIIKKQLVAVPVAVPYYQPVYVAQTLPAPSVSYQITTPAPVQAPPVQYRQPTYAPQMPQYSPPPAYAPPPAQADCGTPALLQLLQKIDARLQALERAPDPNGEPPPPPKKNGNGNGKPPPEDPFNPEARAPQRQRVPSSLTGGCARCHSDQTAQGKGGGFVLWSRGRVAPLADEQIDAAIEKVREGHMPPQPNDEGIPALTEAQAGTLVAFLEGLKRARAGQ